MAADYLKVVAKHLMGKYVEVYEGGNEHGSYDFSEKIRTEKSIIYGKLLDVEGSCLIIEVRKNNKKTGTSYYGKVFLNSWNISAICETSTSISNVYTSEEELKAKKRNESR